MRRVCAWCKQPLDDQEHDFSELITWGICKTCVERIRTELSYAMRGLDDLDRLTVKP